jgi:FAD/FMN-containing dehydrogenase
MFSGASNIDGGLTIDLLKLNQVTVSADQIQTSVGSGNRWIDVYSVLEPKGLAVIGGRVADIGVGGLTLGGGMSFFSGRYGWACDNVNTYEVYASQRVGNSLNSLGLGCLCRRIHP